MCILVLHFIYIYIVKHENVCLLPKLLHRTFLINVFTKNCVFNTFTFPDCGNL
jgi:hypothetical protein